MTKTRLGAVCAISLLALAGCIHVTEEDYSSSDQIAANTEAALRVCGGAGYVQEVTEDGYSCIGSGE